MNTRTFLRLSLCSIALGAITWAQSPLTPATRSVNLPISMNGAPIGNWSGGAILHVDASRSATPVVKAFDRSGRKLIEFILSIPGAQLIKVHSGQFVRGEDGSFAIAGHAYTTDSRGAAFVAWVSADGVDQTIIRVSPYVVSSVVIATDGTIWIAGSDEEASSTSDYDVIRRFDKAGKLLSSTVSNNSLPLTDAKRFVNAASGSSLAAFATNVSWYSEAAGVYVVFGLDGAEVSRTTTPRFSTDIAVRNLTVCNDGRAYIGAQLLKSSSTDGRLGVVEIGRGGSNAVSMFSPLGQHGTLYGCDGSSLVAYEDHGAFGWYPEPPHR